MKQEILNKVKLILKEQEKLNENMSYSEIYEIVETITRDLTFVICEDLYEHLTETEKSMIISYYYQN